MTEESKWGKQEVPNFPGVGVTATVLSLEVGYLADVVDGDGVFVEEGGWERSEGGKGDVGSYQDVVEGLFLAEGVVSKFGGSARGRVCLVDGIDDGGEQVVLSEILGISVVLIHQRKELFVVEFFNVIGVDLVRHVGIKMLVR